MMENSERNSEEMHADHDSEANAKKGKLDHIECASLSNNFDDGGVKQAYPNEAHAAGSDNHEFNVPSAPTVNSHLSHPSSGLGAPVQLTEGYEQSIPTEPVSNADSEHVNSGCPSEKCSIEEKADEDITFKLVFSKQQFDLVARASMSVSELRLRIDELTGVPPANQKLSYRATLLRDGQTIGEAGVTRNAKLMLIGSRPAEIDQVSVSRSAIQLDKDDVSTVISGLTSLSKQEVHRRVLEKYGKPDDAIPGLLNVAHALPAVPLTGMLNKRGAKVRLTFKLEVDELWIGTNERTEKVPMHSIRSVVHDTIIGHEEYAIVGLQLGPTELSRYWLYWVPAQYVKAIRDTILKS